MKKYFAMLLVCVLMLNLSVPAYAAETENDLIEGEAPAVEIVTTVLENSECTQTIVVSEKEMVEEMLDNEVITRTELNDKLATLSEQSEESLRESGYNEDQIDVIKNYDPDDDAFEYVFNSTDAGATLTFQYGLAGENTKKDILIAYDMKWSSCPTFCFTDSFGIGWIAANSNSVEVVTKTDSSMAQVIYYTVDGENAGLYRDVDMDTSSNGVVIGNPVLGKASGNYGKHISGVTQISTQSDSYSIETIHLFVAYAHTTVTFVFSSQITLEWKRVGATFEFYPTTKQELIVEDDHTFKYNAQNIITG